MKKSETEDSNDDVFYSLSSAVSVTASDQTRTPSPSPMTSQTTETKPKGLSRLKAFRPRKLIPKRFKTNEVSSSDATPEVLAFLLKSGSETPPEKLSGKKESKIPKRSRASQIVRRLTFKKGQKVAPKGVVADEDTSTTSSSTTPMSLKRETPEGATLSISEQSLCPVEERSVEESSTEQSERKSSSASSGNQSTKQELKITISGKKIEKLKRFYEKSEEIKKDTRSFEQLKYDVSAITRDTNTASLSSSDKTSLNAVMKTKNNKKSTIAPVLLPSPPPTPLMSIHIPLKLDTPKPISTISTKRDQIPSITAATTRLASNENKNIVTDRDEHSSRQQQQIVSEVTKKSTVTSDKKESLKSKLINKLNISRSVHDITPTVVAPVVPYEISDKEISSIIDDSTPHKQLTPEEYTEFIKQDRDKSLSEQTSEKIFTLSEINEASMKRSEDSDKKQSKIGTNKKRSKKPQQESTDSGLSTSVHVQEPQQPYQKLLSTSKSNDLNDPEITVNVENEVTINKTGEISFRIGTPVRPPATTSNLTNITHITESVSIDSTDNNKSLEEISSISSESQSPPTSESSRKKIKYLPQPTLYSSEEQALLEGNFGPPSSFVGSEYSIDYSLNPLSMVDSTEGTPGTQAGVVRFPN